MKNLKEILKNIVKKERSFEQKITNALTWRRYGYVNLVNDNLLWLLKRRFWLLIDKKFRFGRCFLCGRFTRNKVLLTDDGETTYDDYCCKSCEEYLKEKSLDL